MFYRIVKVSTFIMTLIISTLIASYSVAAEQNSTAIDNAENAGTSSEAKTIEPKPKYTIDPQILAANNSSDEVIWLEAQFGKVLLLKRKAQGKIKRGSILLLHAQGEHADHPRLVSPLAQQLSTLGWEILIPFLPAFDMPKAIISDNINQPEDVSDETTVTNEATSNKNENAADEVTNASSIDGQLNKAFFKNQQQYQEFYSNILKQIIEQVSDEQNSRLLLANQNSAFWTLMDNENHSQFNQMILLEPQTPLAIQWNKNLLKQSPNLPIYLFSTPDETHSDIKQVISELIQESQLSRMDPHTFTSNEIFLQDVRLAKRITGWSDKLNKSKNN